MAGELEVGDAISVIPEDETVLDESWFKSEEVLLLILEMKLMLDAEDETLNGRVDVVGMSSRAEDVAESDI